MLGAAKSDLLQGHQHCLLFCGLVSTLANFTSTVLGVTKLQEKKEALLRSPGKHLQKQTLC